MTIKVKFNFKDIVTPILGERIYMVVSIQIGCDKSVTYGCLDSYGDWKWFKGFEIKLAKDKRVRGFTIDI